MNILKILIFFIAINAWTQKKIYVVIHKENQAQQVYYVVDPEFKVFNLKDFLFRAHGIDSDKYSLVEKNIDGLHKLDDESELGAYGAEADSNVQFYIVPNEYLESPQTP